MDDRRYDDAYRCGFCQGRVYVDGRTTLYYRCAGCGLCPVSLIQANTEERSLDIKLTSSQIALLYSAALHEREAYEYYTVVIKDKWERIIETLSQALEEVQK